MTAGLVEFDWPAQWVSAEPNQNLLQAELAKELGPSHALFGQQAEAIGRRLDQDDVLFALADDRVVEVHLTWSHTTEGDPRWPRAVIYSSFREWAADKAKSTI